jgi:hypothetical protein
VVSEVLVEDLEAAVVVEAAEVVLAREAVPGSLLYVRNLVGDGVSDTIPTASGC